MIDPVREKLVPLGQVPDLPWVPRRRRKARLNASTVFRWTKSGCRGVLLESVRFGNTRCTSEAALTRFLAALAPASPPEAAHERNTNASNN